MELINMYNYGSIELGNVSNKKKFKKLVGFYVGNAADSISLIWL